MARTKKDVYNAPEAIKVNKIMALQRQNDMIAMLLEGKEGKEIYNYIEKKYKIARKTIDPYYAQARKIITQRKNYEIDNLVTLHIARYEHIYARLYELRAFINATKALQNKEKLMGFHREGFHMKVSQGEVTALSLQQVNDEYDVMKLPEEKRNRMTFLLQKAKQDFNKKNR